MNHSTGAKCSSYSFLSSAKVEQIIAAWRLPKIEAFRCKVLLYHFFRKVAQKTAFRESLTLPGFVPPERLSRSVLGQLFF